VDAVVVVVKMQLKKDVRIVKRPNKTLIFSTDVGILYEVNKTGELILDLLKNRQTKNQLYKEMHKQFPKINRKKLQKDIDEFLKKLWQAHLLEK